MKNKVGLISEDVPLQQLVDSLKIEKTALSVFINKSDYVLSVMHGSDTIKQYAVVLGTNPVDDKLREGDRCTPEGNFKVRDLYPHQTWSKFIWIDYPTEESWKKHNKAKIDGKISEEAAIGGEIGIHGTPEGMSGWIMERKNWTHGCISLSRDDIDDLYSVVFKGMDIQIRK